MRSAVLASLLVFVGVFAQAETCKKGDLKDCAKVLKAKEANPEEFVPAYDAVCMENKTFKCKKRTVRGDVKEEMKYVKEENPKAYLYETKDGGENKIFILDIKK